MVEPLSADDEMRRGTRPFSNTFEVDKDSISFAFGPDRLPSSSLCVRDRINRRRYAISAHVVTPSRRRPRTTDRAIDVAKRSPRPQETSLDYCHP